MDKKILSVIVVSILVIAGVGGVLFLNNASNENDNPIDLASNNVYLDIFGNADGNSRIDQNDVKIIEKYLNGETSINDMIKIKDSSGKGYYIADANCDGKITSADVDYVKSLIDRTAEKVNFLDGYKIKSSCKLDPKKIVSEYTSECEMLSLMGVQDRIVSVGNAPYQMKDYFLMNMKDTSKVYNLFNMHSPDYEAIADLEPDLWITHLSNNMDVKKTKTQADVFSPNLTNINLTNIYDSGCVKGALLLGFIFDNTEAGESYAKWLIDAWKYMNDNTSKMNEKDKPTSLYFWYGGHFFDKANTTVTISGMTAVGYNAMKLAGGHNLVDDIAPSKIENGKISIESLVDVESDYLFVHTVKYQGDGKELAYIPDQGFLVDDDTELKDFQENLDSYEIFDYMKDENKYITCNELWHGGSGGILLAAQLGHILHPDLYSEKYVSDLLQEYVDIMGYDFDSSKHGVFWHFNS